MPPVVGFATRVFAVGGRMSHVVQQEHTCWLDRQRAAPAWLRLTGWPLPPVLRAAHSPLLCSSVKPSTADVVVRAVCTDCTIGGGGAGRRADINAGARSKLPGRAGFVAANMQASR